MNRDEPVPSTTSDLANGPLSVDIVRRSPVWARARIDAGALVGAARAAYAAGGGRGASEMALVLSGDDDVRALNRKWRGLDRPTNVLAFPAGAEDGADAFAAGLGDVVLAYETVAREAAEAGVSATDHARHLVVHGVLHLLGYDHHTEEGAARMEELESRILTGMGIVDPYAATAV